MTNWADTHPDFTEELQKEWKERKFSAEEIREWLDVGAKIDDYEFIYWLRNNSFDWIKKKEIEWILVDGSEEDFRNEYKMWKLSKESEDYLKLETNRNFYSR